VAGPTFRWSAADEFIGRQEELSRLESWWDGNEREPLSLYGRRRCGKSWLFRRFADGKPAVVLVARRVAPGAQLAEFAERLELVLGVRPALDSLADLFRVIYRAARTEKLLVVIDEFPYLLATTENEIERELSVIAAIMEEERDASKLKLILCGSLVSQMESLLAERGPLHGRLVPLHLQPVTFPEARLFLKSLDSLAQFERFAITGGMPRYLISLGRGNLRATLCDRVLSPNAALWDEARTILEQELREPKVYFSILQSLASGDKELNEIVNALHADRKVISKYLNVLEAMRVVERRLPITAEATSRSGHWHLRDPFFRFWFRFVFPFQDDLESGLDPRTLFDAEIAPALSDHVGPEFEEYCRRWTRMHHEVTRVGSWWGPPLNELRRAGVRSSEEIDVVGMARSRVVVVGEARWRSGVMDLRYLTEIEQFKIPALRQSGVKVAAAPIIVLFSRGGYHERLVEAASEREDVVLVEVRAALEQ
jgi:AAA+ ATPase superfamily predicted ATPase